MNDLQVFGFEGRNVRVVDVKGDPWWVLRDVCGVLDISNSRNVSDRLDDDEKGVRQMDTPGGVQEMTIINESGLFSAILRSEKPEAKAFKKWITSEVLPSIRKTGHYSTMKITAPPPVRLLSEANRAVSLKLITPEQGGQIILSACRSTTGKPAYTPTLHDSATPLLDILGKRAFSDWKLRLENNSRVFERYGVCLCIVRGRKELRIAYNDKELTKIAGEGYRAALTRDPAYVETKQARIAGANETALIFDWDVLTDTARPEAIR